MLPLLTTPLCRNASGILLVFSVICIFAAPVYAQGNSDASGGMGNTASSAAQQSLPEMAPIQPVRTDSPRETLRTFLRLRALDRSLISIPNAAFADMEIVNWAKCDRMLILTTIGLRYETEPDQLRYVLVKLRELFHVHPRIDRNTVRVRFAGYGASSLDVEIRVYALTREWNDFYAIREDAFFRVNEIVRNSGTGFAFPSQTLYMSRDDGLDEDRGHAAMQEVASWRRSSQLPFHRLAAWRVGELAAALDYPLHRSPDADSPKDQVSEAAEPLSAESQLEDTNETEQQPEPERR